MRISRWEIMSQLIVGFLFSFPKMYDLAIFTFSRIWCNISNNYFILKMMSAGGFIHSKLELASNWHQLYIHVGKIVDLENIFQNIIKRFNSNYLFISLKGDWHAPNFRCTPEFCYLYFRRKIPYFIYKFLFVHFPVLILYLLLSSFSCLPSHFTFTWNYFLVLKLEFPMYI